MNSSLVLPLLVVVTLAAIALAVILPRLTGESRTDKRRRALIKNPAVSKQSRQERSREAMRRQAIAEGLRDLRKRGEAKKDLGIETLLEQAGLPWSKQQFQLYSLLVGLVLGLVVFIALRNIYAAAAFAGLTGWIVPKWYVKRARAKRFAAFVAELPNALDILVRGVRAGLGPNQCFEIIGRETKEPVRSEFLAISEAQRYGLSLSDAVQKLTERMPISEANFFAIAIVLQSKTGGKLAEIMDGLSKVVRQRKQMKAKISAYSAEAKTSSGIIGALPVFVLGSLQYSSPDYVAPLWNTNVGLMGLAGAVCWIGLGAFIIKKMSNFEI
ncbi:type II secretion system F family protein [Microvirga tunisiensis]|uniref:Type II secretion system F family protein n=1 Tax=Microvirga tunisiensis TaxID=2108360 RepID=A0A5N7MBB5_9HYPH|nr:type II secretion system F family protein [Microvirga tunisiensis]MPR08142.1 type II secretion system F family protein [Microvirga tunisiensis]MPR24145.1 type II secretion system F family protein [Microvirga tunisiensis]